MAANSLLLLRRTSPLRPVNWRWQLATELRAEHGSDGCAGQDEGVRAAAAIQNATAASSTAAVAARAITRLGPVADAYAFWETGDLAAKSELKKPDDWTPMYGPLTPQAIAMAEFEGFVLAGKSARTIARRTGLSEASVAWYESLWFDVRDRLKHTSWILANVIGTLHQGTIGTLLPALIRSYGFQSRSARIVSAVAGGFDTQMTRNAAKSPESFFAADAMFAGALKANLAIRLMPLGDRRTYARMVELHQEATRISADVAAGSGSDAENKLRAAVTELGSQIRFKYGKAPPIEAAAARLIKLQPHAPAEDVG